jgi:hypothetical protein
VRGRVAIVMVMVTMSVRARAVQADTPPEPPADRSAPLRADDSAWLHAPEGPWLHLDPVLPSSLENLGVTHDHQTVTRTLGPDTRIILDGSWWSADPDLPTQGFAARDVAGQGWRTSLRGSRRLGPVEIGASAALEFVDGRYGRGTFAEVGLSVGKTVKLSRWMTAWISLSLGRRRWLGEGPPPAGEADATQIMLSIGTTFR